MTPTEFCFWLQGLFELGRPTKLNAEQTEAIRRNLANVAPVASLKPAPAPAGEPPATPATS